MFVIIVYKKYAFNAAKIGMRVKVAMTPLINYIKMLANYILLEIVPTVAPQYKKITGVIIWHAKFVQNNFAGYALIITLANTIINGIV